MINYPKEVSDSEKVFTGTWCGKIPVFTVMSQNALNQLVGYTKHINAGNGTVLYRGQCNLYPNVMPSISRDKSKLALRSQQLETAINNISSDKFLNRFFDFNTPHVIGWDLYKRLTIESALQHYGGKTYCVDFVDNHWTALWFGLYKWDEIGKQYIKRTMVKENNEDDNLNNKIMLPEEKKPPKPPATITVSDLKPEQIVHFKDLSTRSKQSFDLLVQSYLNKRNSQEQAKWVQRCQSVEKNNLEIRRQQVAFQEDDKIGHMYLFLFVADTNTPSLNGIYFGDTTYTIDLRKNLPSTFLRPCSQHGWIVRGKDTGYSFEERIACVIRINVSLVDLMLGNGSLVSCENFFPSYEQDQGYHVLLERQENNPIPAKKGMKKIIPQNTIEMV